MDLGFKNTWLNLTIVLPGLVTYGSWRFIILITEYHGINFSVIDNSTVLSICVLFAVALIQQAIGITIESIITGICYLNRNKWVNLYELFVERFSNLQKQKFNEDVLRTIGQFFLSLNLAVGQIMIFIFYILSKNPEGMSPVQKPIWLYILLAGIVVITINVAIFRCWNAVKSIKSGLSFKVHRLT